MISLISKAKTVEFLDSHCNSIASFLISNIKNVVRLENVEDELIYVSDMRNLLTKSIADEIECAIIQYMTESNNIIK